MNHRRMDDFFRGANVPGSIKAAEEVALIGPQRVVAQTQRLFAAGLGLVVEPLVVESETIFAEASAL